MTQAVGRRGERLAEEHFVSLGAQVLERNYHVRYAEVDLILIHEGDLVAVEVKSRNVADLEAPEEAIRHAQVRRIIRGLITFA
ncbi:MAG: YraN family protein, partial [Chloroflexi bacterium]|nr:YraN family protein [Chloroflexota bacterium]